MISSCISWIVDLFAATTKRSTKLHELPRKALVVLRMCSWIRKRNSVGKIEPETTSSYRNLICQAQSQE